MSESGYDPEWYKKAAAQKLERTAAKARSASAGDTFLIVTEGTVTEPTYFKLLRADLQLKAVTVKIEPGWASDPLQDCLDAKGIKVPDNFWLNMQRSYHTHLEQN